MTRTVLGIAAQIVGAVAVALLVPLAGRALGDALSAIFIAHHLGF